MSSSDLPQSFQTNPDRSKRWSILLTAASFIGLGIAVSAVVAGTIAYRSTHVVDYGMVNSRVIRIRSPIDGTLNTFYAQPGAKVEAGQVLATVGISLAEKKVLQQAAELAQIKKNGLEEQMQAKKNELSVARQLLLDLKSQLNSLNSRVNQVWTVDGDMLSKDLKQRQMELEVSRLKAEAAQVEYERFNTLAQEGAITQQVAHQRKLDWETAVAEVSQAELSVKSAKSILEASQQKNVMGQTASWGNRFVQDATGVQQSIKVQNAKIKTLMSEVLSAERQLKQVQPRPSNERKDLNIIAPKAGVIYRTEREQYELVNQSEPVLSLLDCNNIWVEVVMPTDQASQLSKNKPVQIELASGKEVHQGEITVLQPLNNIQMGESASSSPQVKALETVISPQMAGKALTQVTVKIPPPEESKQTNQFCGVGQRAKLVFGKQPNWFSNAAQFFHNSVKGVMPKS